jgi:acylphosphatase
MSDDDDLTSLRLKIEGFVQAVGYRHFAIGEARKLALDGWVRNCADGTVEVLVSGPNKAVETFVGLCMRGPQGAFKPSGRISPGRFPVGLRQPPS